MNKFIAVAKYEINIIQYIYPIADIENCIKRYTV